MFLNNKEVPLNFPIFLSFSFRLLYYEVCYHFRVNSHSAQNDVRCIKMSAKKLVLHKEVPLNFPILLKLSFRFISYLISYLAWTNFSSPYYLIDLRFLLYFYYTYTLLYVSHSA